MYECAKCKAAAALEIERTKVLASRLHPRHRQQVIDVVLDVATTMAKMNSYIPAECDLAAIAKSLMEVILVIENDR